VRTDSMVNKNNFRSIDRIVQAMFATVAELFQYACSCANPTPLKKV
jgi:hypothetical protein